MKLFLSWRPLHTHIFLMLGAILALCGLGSWLFVGRDSVVVAPSLQQSSIPTHTTPRTPAAITTATVGQIEEQFRAASAQQTADAPGSQTGTTDCVALLSTFDRAMGECNSQNDRKLCALNAIKKRGFDPATYDFCKLRQPSVLVSPFS